jgi:hypothetical protein
MTTEEKVFALGEYVIELQRNFHALQAVMESRGLAWRAQMEQTARQEELREIARAQLASLRQEFDGSKSDSELINALHRAFLEEDQTFA